MPFVRDRNAAPIPMPRSPSMKRLRLLALLAAPLALTCLHGRGAFADAGVAPAPAPASSTVVVRIGDRTITSAAIEKALAGVPAFELAALGSTNREILRKYVDEAIVHEELLAAAARTKGALDERGVKLQLTKALASSLVRKELAAIGTRDDVPLDEVKAYYDAHVADYQQPERVRIWHLVVATKEAADAALAKVKKDPTREGWPKLVAETSLDLNSNKSSGDLGFVSADGKTSEPKIAVPLEVAKAAFALKDGELVAEPVKSAVGYHVVWRKGSVPATARTLADETLTIRAILYEQKCEKTYKALVDRLRGQAKIEIDEQALPLVTVEVAPRVAPKQPASVSASAPTK
jgi:peptidyl-prolyl cis-trans isomerase C